MKKYSKFVVSACLTGENCKYNGGNNFNEKVKNFLADKQYITVCPEVYGGLSTPRDPSEIILCDGELKVISDKGKDVTEEFVSGAQQALKEALESGCDCAIFKAKSPSCGSGEVYDGTFSSVLIKGDGVTAKLFRENGIDIFTEKEIHLLDELIV
ncbi:MAG: DUF523 domain-containing protein [Anaerofustis stercorihominis]|nr:DUF523 domain-containing protein [Anaerofustis stercorihominis]